MWSAGGARSRNAGAIATRDPLRIRLGRGRGRRHARRMTTIRPSRHDDDHFDAEVLEADRPVLVDFTAAWCPPCRVMKPVLAELAAERDDLRIVQLDVDDNQRHRRRATACCRCPRSCCSATARPCCGSSARGRSAGSPRPSSDRGRSASAAQRASSSRRRATAGRRGEQRRRGGAAPARPARATPTAGPGGSSHERGTTLTPSPAAASMRTVAGSPTSNSGTGLKPAAWQAAITVSRSALPGSARMNGRPRRSPSATARPGAAGRPAAASRAAAPRRAAPRRRRRRGRPRAPATARSAAPLAHQLDDLGRRRWRSASWMPGCSRWNAASAPGSRGASPVVAATRTRPRVGAGVPVHLGPRARHLGQDRLGAREQLLAGRRELDAARRALQQRDAELGLQPAHLLRQRGLRDPQRVGRAR